MAACPPCQHGAIASRATLLSTEGAHSIVPVCPAITKGGGKGGPGCKEHGCERFHCQHPGYRRPGARKKSKRARADPDEPILAGDSDGEE